MAAITARISPRPCGFPVLLKTFTMRCTYGLLGLLFTRCWMSCLQMNGPALGWFAILSSAAFRSAAGVRPAGITCPLSSVFDPLSWKDAIETSGPLILIYAFQ